MSDKKTVADIREALWECYSVYKNAGMMDGKFAEGSVTVYYDNIWDDIETGNKDRYVDAVPSGVHVYSYTCGPSRGHDFIRGDKEKNPDYWKWISPDPMATAVRVINEWKKEAEAAVAGWEAEQHDKP